MVACNHAVSEALTAQDAEIDKDITRKLQAPEGPDVYLSLQQSARNNAEDTYGLAREACQIMADNIKKDILRFTLSDEDSAVLQRLAAELEQTNPTYHEWVRMSVKFSVITGFIRYRNEPEKYSKTSLFGKEPDTSTSLMMLEEQPWELIDHVLKGKYKDAPDHLRQKEEINILYMIVMTLNEITESRHFISPCFQPLDIEYFVRINALGYRPIAVSLEDEPVVADGYRMSRGMFLLHDLRHARDFFVSNGKNITETTMRAQHLLTAHLYNQKDEINRLHPGLFIAVELVLFYATHESPGVRPALVFLFENGTRGAYRWPSGESPLYSDPIKSFDWIALGYANAVFHGLKKQYCDLEVSHGFLAKEDNPSTLELAAVWLTSLSEELCKKLVDSSTTETPITQNDFDTAVYNSCQEFNNLKHKYNCAKAHGYTFRHKQARPDNYHGPFKYTRKFMFGG